MKTTSLYDRLPSIAGVHFGGFENIKIESRENVTRKLEDFIKYCRSSAKGTAVCMILGEWGQGKTETFKRSIEPLSKKGGDYAFFVSASTLSNSYQNKEVSKICDKTPLTSLKFLVNLFNSIKAESNDESIGIPSLEDYLDPEDYMENVLDNLLSKNKSKRIFIFIDEFEELLLNMDHLKSIVSGIKETINGVYKPIHEGGKYSGSLHIFISITPDAYNKLQVHEETSLIFGGLGRRIEIIELQELRKKEGLAFLKALLEYSYNYNLPRPYPIENLGLFNTLLRISQNNIGNIVTLYTKLFNNLKKDDKLEILNYKNLLRFLKREKIFVFGAEAPCIEKDKYYKIMECLSDQRTKELGELTKELFKLFIGEFKPFKLDELVERTGEDEDTILRSINLLNEDLKREEKIEKSIIKVAPLKDDVSIEDVFDPLKYYIITDEITNKDMISIDSYSESITDFEDRITFFEFGENGELIPQAVLPVDEIDIKLFFKNEISEDKAVEIRNSLKRFIKDEIMYLASDLLLNEIFPTPIPRALEFIKNKEIRLKLWREISRNLTDEYSKNMPQAFITVLDKSKYYNLDFVDSRENYSIFELENPKDETQIKTMFYVVNGDVKGVDIDYISEILNNEMSINLTILLYNGDFTYKAEEKIQNKELDEKNKYLILKTFLHPTLTKKIICCYKSLNEYAEFIDEERLELECKDIISRELNLDSKIDEWLNKQVKKGLVIDQIETTARSLSEFADGLKLYINYMEKAYKPEEIFDKNIEGILKFRKYGTKTGFISSDFEDSPKKVEEISLDLQKNGFLDKNPDGSYKVKQHPVEMRILEIMKKEKKVSPSEFRDYFIIKQKTGKIFEDVFLNILEYKGKIRRKGKSYTLVDKEEAYNSLKVKLKKYNETIKEETLKTFDHFYVTKKREDKLIMLDEVNEFIETLWEKIEALKASLEEDLLLQKISLCNKLLEQIEKEILPAIKKASKRGRSIIEEIERKRNDLERDFDYIVNNSQKWLNIRFKKENILEYKNLMRNHEKIVEIYKKICSKEELNKIRDNENFDKDQFYFNKKIDHAHYFNIKLFELKKLKEQFNDNVNIIKKLIDRNRRAFENINERWREYKRHITTLDIPPNYKISYCISEKMKLDEIDNNETAHTINRDVKLSWIEKQLKEKEKAINDKLTTLLEQINDLKSLAKKEENLLLCLEKSKDFVKKIDYIFDIKNLKIIVTSFKEKVLRLEKEYEELDPIEIAENKTENPKDFIERWIETLKFDKDNIDQEWKHFVQSTFLEFINRSKKICKLLKQKGINTAAVEKRVEELSNSVKTPLNKLEYSASSLKGEKDIIREELKKLSDPFLTTNEFRVLEILESVKGKSKWVDYDKIKQKALKEMNEDALQEALGGLLSKGYLKKGFSLILSFIQ
ncbi:conserved hypothetical protein [Methanothermobacter sp. MT-2]|nr:conserved hypothetical protein [Methanothermobacter sp. MT-2]HHW05109.1 hypothetical protein [Methanothermobacter sp.]HPU36905.1 hypothetical protein [Methanothermobacter sp.]